jgi:hypothetical protein
MPFNGAQGPAGTRFNPCSSLGSSESLNDGELTEEARSVASCGLSKSGGGFQAAKETWLMLVASYPNLSGADLAVTIAIFKHLNSRSGDAWPSIETISSLTNREASTVWRSIEKLKILGLLKVQKGRGRQQSNRYRPALGALDRDPKTLRRRKKNTANWKKKDCEPE